MEIVYITVLTTFAVTVGTLAGFGTSTIMTPILLLFFPFNQTLLLVGIIHWFEDIWKIILFRRGLHWQFILLFGIPGIFTAIAGAQFIFIQEEYLLRLLGCFFIAYVVFLLFRPSFKLRKNALIAILGGSLSGFCAEFSV